MENLVPQARRPVDAALPLSHIRVIDFTHFIAGPFATMMLADMGADVIKVEAPGRGDDFRNYPPVEPTLEAGAPFVWTNRNKRSVTLDLKHPHARKTALALIAEADVVVENFSTGVMERLSLDYEELKLAKPDLIFCSISAYGRTGSFADRGGFDPIAQAESGYISMNGYADRDGVRSLSPIMDMSTALMACNAILGALIARHKSGEGQYVEVALFDTAVQMTGYAALQQLITGSNPVRNGNVSPDTCPSGPFAASDRNFLINCGNTGIFHRLMGQVLDRPDIATSPRYATNRDRVEHRAEIFAILDELFATQPWSFWKERLREANVPCGELRSISDMVESDEVRERGLITRIPHPDLGWVPNMVLPIRYSETPLADPIPAPRIGQHNDEVLRDWLTLDDAAIAALRADGVLGTAAAGTGD